MPSTAVGDHVSSARVDVGHVGLRPGAAPSLPPLQMVRANRFKTFLVDVVVVAQLEPFAADVEMQVFLKPLMWHRPTRVLTLGNASTTVLAPPM